MDNKLQEAVKTLIEALKSDEDYRRSWSANIAMAFKDECYREFKEDLYTEYGDAEEEIHKIANTAADNFLNLLCEDGSKD